MSEVAPEADLLLEPIILGTMDVWTMDFSDFCCLPSLFFAAVSELSGGKPRQLLQHLGRFVLHSQGHTGFFFPPPSLVVPQEPVPLGSGNGEQPPCRVPGIAAALSSLPAEF